MKSIQQIGGSLKKPPMSFSIPIGDAHKKYKKSKIVEKHAVNGMASEVGEIMFRPLLNSFSWFIVSSGSFMRPPSRFTSGCLILFLDGEVFFEVAKVATLFRLVFLNRCSMLSPFK